jgi:hypothetical protein
MFVRAGLSAKIFFWRTFFPRPFLAGMFCRWMIKGALSTGGSFFAGEREIERERTQRVTKNKSTTQEEKGRTCSERQFEVVRTISTPLGYIFFFFFFLLFLFFFFFAVISDDERNGRLSFIFLIPQRKSATNITNTIEKSILHQFLPSWVP